MKCADRNAEFRDLLRAAHAASSWEDVCNVAHRLFELESASPTIANNDVPGLFAAALHIAQLGRDESSGEVLHAQSFADSARALLAPLGLE